ncbi:MAG: DNA gyrase C-terminal beta-propeller domain-containing protein, partial [Candidatus Thiodiazotropha endolucinida]
SNMGKVYWLKVYELPQAGRNARGKPIVNLLPLDEEEQINAILPVREYEANRYVFMATSSGTVKKTSLEAFSRPRANGIIAVDLRDGDKLVGVAITDGEQDILLFSSSGKAVRFSESKVRAMGRTACGVRGIRLEEDHQVVSLIVADEGDVLTVTENGYGKRTAIEEYPVHGRGGRGVISIQTSERNGTVVGAVQVVDEDEVMMISDGGTLVRNRVSEISQMGRNTQGVIMIRLSSDERLIGVERVENLDTDGDDDVDPDQTDMDD